MATASASLVFRVITQNAVNSSTVTDYSSFALCYGFILSCRQSIISLYRKAIQNASEAAIVSHMQSIVLESRSAALNLTNYQEGPPNVATLYSALNITPTENVLSDFTDAFDVITDAYFKACYGPENERQNASKAQGILSEFLSLLENRSDITRMRQTFG